MLRQGGGLDYEHCVLTIAALARSTLHQPQILSLKKKTSLLRLHAASYCQKQVIEATKSQERREDEKQSDAKKRGQNKEMSAEGENDDQRSPPSSSSPPEAVKKEPSKNNKNTAVPAVTAVTAGATNETKIQLICTQTMDVNGGRGLGPSPSKSMEEESLSPALISKLENFLQRKVDIDGGNLFKHRQRRNVMSHHSFSILLTSLTIITFLLLKFSFIIEKLNLSGSQYSSCVSNLKNNIFI